MNCLSSLYKRRSYVCTVPVHQGTKYWVAFQAWKVIIDYIKYVRRSIALDGRNITIKMLEEAHTLLLSSYLAVDSPPNNIVPSLSLSQSFFSLSICSRKGLPRGNWILKRPTLVVNFGSHETSPIIWIGKPAPRDTVLVKSRRMTGRGTITKHCRGGWGEKENRIHWSRWACLY